MNDPVNDKVLKDLEYYLVGGALRDSQLGLAQKDRDWVVVGTTPAQMESRGFRPVGRDFPVFLHPTTHEQYALARTERKTARGYRGFSIWTSPDVSLEQDLARRDLTINAMAQAPDGRIIDPFNGARDLNRGVLRHVSPAFAEDPLRVLRVARFMARFGARGFIVADETLELMRHIVAADEMEALTPERVWQEMRGALAEPRPDLFITTLRDCGALVRVLPEVDALFGIPQPARYHPEIDTGQHILLVMQQAALLSDAPEVRFGALLHDVGKALTPNSEWPSHIKHEIRGLVGVDSVCDRLRVPTAYRALAKHVCRYHLVMHCLDQLKPVTVLKLLKSIDALRKPQQLEYFGLACEADSRGRHGRENVDYPQRTLLLTYRNALKSVDLGDVGTLGLAPAQIAEQVKRRQIKALAVVKSNWKP